MKLLDGIRKIISGVGDALCMPLALFFAFAIDIYLRIKIKRNDRKRVERF